MKREKTVLYENDRILKLGFLVGWKEMFLDLFLNSELIWRLFMRDFSSKYRQSLLGVSWAILNPIIFISVFIFLNRSGIFNMGEINVPYPVFALIGLTVYGIFSTGLSVSANSIVGAGSIVAKINFPKISLVVSTFGQAIVEFKVRLVLLAVVFAIFGVVPKWTAIFFPIAIIPVILLTLGLGFLLSLITGIFRDTTHVVSFIVTFLLFLTPVLYPVPETGPFVILNAWNPLSHLIVGCRDLIISGALSNHDGFMWSAIFSVTFFLVSWRIFYLSETKIAERI